MVSKVGKVGGRSDVFSASTCLVSANVLIAIARVSSMLFVSRGVWSLFSCCHSSVVVNQDMKLGKVTL